MTFRPRLRFRPGLVNVNEPPKASKSRLASGITQPGRQQNSTDLPAKVDRVTRKTRPGHQQNLTDLPAQLDRVTSISTDLPAKLVAAEASL